jgi:hypothetical protein
MDLHARGRTSPATARGLRGGRINSGNRSGDDRCRRGDDRRDRHGRDAEAARGLNYRVALSRKGKRSIWVDGEEFLWRSNTGGVHVSDLVGELNVISHAGLVLVKGRRFRSVAGCGGLHRLFKSPDFFWIAIYPSTVREFIRWAVCVAVVPGRDPQEVDRDGLTGSLAEQSSQLREREAALDRADRADRRHR